MSTSAVAQKTDGNPVQSEESLVCEDFVDREAAQDEFDSVPDGDGEVCEEEFGDPPTEPPLAVDNPAAPRPALATSGPRPPLRLLPLLGPRPLPSPPPPPSRDVGELMNAGGPEAGPVPKRPSGDCPEAFPQERDRACYS